MTNAFLIYAIQPANIFYGLFFLAIIIGVIFLISRIPFGQVMELQGEYNLSTFYKVGPLKLKYVRLGKIDTITLEHNPSRYYCLTIKTSEGETLMIEKYPNLNEANERLNEFKKIFQLN